MILRTFPGVAVVTAVCATSLWAAAPDGAGRAKGSPVKPPPVQMPAEATFQPVVHEWQKEAFNFWAELKTGLQQRAYQDVAQAIYGAGAEARRGLLTDLRDPQLLVPYRTLIDLVIRDDPQVRSALVEHYGRVAPVRLSAAIAEADFDALETLAVQFAATPTAVDALQWLGDRSLASGRFEQALGYYGRAGQNAEPSRQPALAARYRLAGAMLGRSVGDRVQATVEIGDWRLAAAQFETLIAELVKAHASDSAVAAAGGAAHSELAAALTPGPLAAQSWPREAESDKEAARSRARERSDWTAGLVSAVADSRSLVLSDGRHLEAYQLDSDRKLWSRELGDVRFCPPPWKAIPLRPLVAGQRAYVRHWTDRGIELNCLEMEHGQSVWSSTPQQYVVTDPVWDQSRILVVTAAIEEIPVVRKGRSAAQVLWRNRSSKLPTPWLLQLTALDPSTGKVLEQRPLVRLQSKEQSIPVCRAVLADDLLVLTFHGGVLAADRSGGLHWLRRMAWQPGDSQPPGPATPVVAAGQVFLVPSQLATIQALELANGRLQWECPAPGVTRLLGVVGGRLIALDNAGLLAVEAASGRMAWRHPIDEPLQGFFCGGSGQLAYTAFRRDELGRWCPAVVWLDPANGEPAAQHLVDGLKPARHLPKNALLGPVLPVGRRLLAVYRDASQGRRGLLELQPAETREEAARNFAEAWWE